MRDRDETAQPARYVVEVRPEPEFAKRWGLRSALDGKWLPVMYPTEREAVQAVRALAPRAR